MTPPSLASQWVDELALHAPGLRVLVYEGWTKLKVPVTKWQIEQERKKRAEAKRDQIAQACWDQYQQYLAENPDIDGIAL